MPAWRIAILTLCAIYVVASVYAAFTLQDLRYRRFVPLASILILFVPWLFHFLPRWMPYIYIEIFCLPLSAALVCDTLRVFWSGRRLVERILRMTSFVFIVYFICAVLFQGIP